MTADSVHVFGSTLFVNKCYSVNKISRIRFLEKSSSYFRSCQLGEPRGL